MKLLVVEDEDRIASFLIRGLRAQGFNVEGVVTGRDALEQAGHPDLDLMILDLGLPDMDGTEVLDRLREEGNQLPVIVLTAREHDGPPLAVDGYMTKPFSFKELVAAVRASLAGRSRAG
jgi:two-component system, OmpR family, copper resistance phosphate regulon response regulator CusR